MLNKQSLKSKYSRLHERCVAERDKRFRLIVNIYCSRETTERTVKKEQSVKRKPKPTPIKWKYYVRKKNWYRRNNKHTIDAYEIAVGKTHRIPNGVSIGAVCTFRRISTRLLRDGSKWSLRLCVSVAFADQKYNTIIIPITVDVLHKYTHTQTAKWSVHVSKGNLINAIPYKYYLCNTAAMAIDALFLVCVSLVFHSSRQFRLVSNFIGVIILLGAYKTSTVWYLYILYILLCLSVYACLGLCLYWCYLHLINFSLRLNIYFWLSIASRYFSSNWIFSKGCARSYIPRVYISFSNFAAHKP